MSLASLTYNQLKTYLVNSYNTLAGTSTTVGQVDSRNWSGCHTTLDGIISEVNLFRSENPTHKKVVYDSLGNSIAEELVLECQELKKDIVSIQEYIANNTNAEGFQQTYDGYVQHFKDRLKMVADRFNSA